MINLTIHPLLISVLESFDDLRQTRDVQQANFTATLSRILSDAFLAADPEAVMPDFLTDEGVAILRLDITEAETTRAPGAKLSIEKMTRAFHEARAASPDAPVSLTSGSFALCSQMPDLKSLLCHPVLMEGGFLGFFDPIYEDSLMLIGMEKASLAAWQLRHCSEAAQAA